VRVRADIRFDAYADDFFLWDGAYVKHLRNRGRKIGQIHASHMNSIIDNHLNWFFGRMKLSAITPRDVERWQDIMLERPRNEEPKAKPLSATSINHALICLRRSRGDSVRIFYQINYTIAEVPEECAYFHAQFRRVNPLPYKEAYSMLDGVEGDGHYVGTYMAWGVNNSGWWGEGEIKFYLDGDEWPTICGTGTEDYFCGSYNFEARRADGTAEYREFTTPYAGMPQVLRPDGLYNSQQRFGLYRWHIADPIRFRRNLRVTIQALGWRDQGRYHPQQDDIASVAYWYQTLPTAPFPELPDRDALEIV
jgi:hypothetical protein